MPYFQRLDRDSLLVKSCGFKDVPGAITAAKAGSDFIGLVFAEGSPRTADAHAMIHAVNIGVSSHSADARAMIHAVNIAKCQPETGAAPPSKKAKQELRFTFEDQKLPREEAPPLP
ncbi:hypothetical protein T484DRAFT_1854090 [Baffinella frigidus]|nr:hypothetical protein T484DRAFT_1854090 [Cryptophyta sp. CCMP2293]